MPLLDEKHFRCDLKKPDGSPDCDVEFWYDPGGPNRPPPVWDAGTQARLNKVVAVVHPLIAFTTFWCSDEHAIEAIKRGQHLPPLPSKIAPATDADLARAKSGMKVVESMRGAKPS